MSQWIRKVRCTIDSLVIEDLRIEFSIKKDIAGSPNLAKVRIFNLRKDKRKQIKDEFKGVLIEAGYRDGAFGVLHSGTIRTVLNSREGSTDIVTNVESGDGDLSHRFGFINKTFEASETKPRNIILEIQKIMPAVKLGELRGVDNLPPLKRPLTLIGTASNELDTLCRKHDLYWSVQNGYLEVIPHDEYIREVTVVSRDTGMIGTPDITELGVHVKTLLNHNIRPNRLINVISEEEGATGLFRVNEVTYVGNNHDGSYECDIQGARVESGVKHQLYKKDI